MWFLVRALSYLLIATFLLCPYVADREKESSRGQESSSCLFLLFTLMFSSKPNRLLKNPLPNTGTLGVRISTYKFRGQNVHTLEKKARLRGSAARNHAKILV